MENSNKKTTNWFWIISIVALIWNIMGVAAYLGQAYMTDEVLATLPEQDQLYYANVPPFITGAFAIAVFSGFIGCVLLLFRKKLANYLLIVSFIAVIIQSVYNFFIQKYMVVDLKQTAWTLVIILIALFLVWYSNKLTKEKILT
jgi:hypothetical protein